MTIQSTALALAIGLMSTIAYADALADKKCSDAVQKGALKFKSQVFKDVGRCLSEIQKCNLATGVAAQSCKENLIDTSLKGKAKCSSSVIDGGFLLFGPLSAVNSGGSRTKSSKQLNQFGWNVQKRCIDSGADIVGLGYGNHVNGQDFVDALNDFDGDLGYACKELANLVETIPDMIVLLQDLLILDDSLVDPRYMLAPSLRYLVDGQTPDDCGLVPFNP